MCNHLGWAPDLCRYFRQEDPCNVNSAAKPAFRLVRDGELFLIGGWCFGHVGGSGLVWFFRMASMLVPGDNFSSIWSLISTGLPEVFG